MIEDAKYTDNVVFENNPYIEALPPMVSEKQLIHEVARYPAVNEELRKASKSVRIQMVAHQLKEFYQPLPFIIDIYVQVYCAIQAAYANYGISTRGYRWSESSGISFSVVGVSGIGKSSAINRILSMFPEAIRHKEYHGEQMKKIQIPYIEVQTPHDASIRGLCVAILSEIDKTVNILKDEAWKLARYTADLLVSYLVKAIRTYHVGLLIIDEIQNVHAGDTKFINFIVQLVNSTNVSICFVGTPQAIEPLKQTMRAARRATCIEIDRMKKNLEFNLILNAAWRIQYTTTPQPLTDKIRDVLYNCSSGITDILVRLLYFGQVEAIMSGKEKLTPEIFDKVAKNKMRITNEAIRKGTFELKSGQNSDIGFAEMSEKNGDDRPLDICEVEI